MLKMMYKWTSDFEKNKPEFEEKLKMYNHKLIIANSNKINKILKALDKN